MRPLSARELFEFKFGSDGYDFRIYEDYGVVIGGCDCESEMSDEEALKVYWALDEYLISKGLLSERWG